MPVRKIPRSHTTVQGKIYFKPRGWSFCFESLLERDFFILQFFDDSVEEVEEQPVVIEWQDKDDKQHRYVPDARVAYTDGSTILFEVKPKRILKKKTKELSEKFAAAKDYATERGWKFSVVTEEDIRTERFENSKFLYPFATEPTPPHHAACFFHALCKTKQGKASVSELLDLVAGTEEEKDVMRRSLWQLLSQGKLKTNLNRAITTTTCLSLNKNAWTILEAEAV